jgi:hypothetical protein
MLSSDKKFSENKGIEMKRPIHFIVFLIFTLFLQSGCPAKKQEVGPSAPATSSTSTAPGADGKPDLSSPEGATKAFYDSVNLEKFNISWNTLSKTSQDKIVIMVAEEEKLDPKEVRQLFDTNSQAIQAGFWKSFKNSSKVDQYAPGAVYKVLKVDGSEAQIQLSNKLVVLDSKAFKEDGQWKMGYVESFMDQPAPPAPSAP